MKIDVNEKRELILKEIYTDTVLETKLGNQLFIAMRDDTIEMSVRGSDLTYRVNMETGKIEEL